MTKEFVTRIFGSASNRVGNPSMVRRFSTLNTNHETPADTLPALKIHLPPLPKFPTQPETVSIHFADQLASAPLPPRPKVLNGNVPRRPSFVQSVGKSPFTVQRAGYHTNNSLKENSEESESISHRLNVGNVGDTYDGYYATPGEVKNAPAEVNTNNLNTGDIPVNETVNDPVTDKTPLTSTYEKTNGTGVLLHDQESILECTKEILKKREGDADEKPSLFILVDFGGGDGRNEPAMFEATKLANASTKCTGTHLVVEDLSPLGLQKYLEKCKKRGFVLVNNGDRFKAGEHKEGYLGPLMMRVNSDGKTDTISFMVNHQNDPQSHTKALYRQDKERIDKFFPRGGSKEKVNVDLVTSIYGPTASIVLQAARIELYKRMVEILGIQGMLYLTVSSKNRFIKQQKRFDDYRDQGVIQIKRRDGRIYDVPPEKDTFLYDRPKNDPKDPKEKEIILPYVVYDPRDIVEELEKAKTTEVMETQKNGTVQVESVEVALVVKKLAPNFVHLDMKDLLTDPVAARFDMRMCDQTEQRAKGIYDMYKESGAPHKVAQARADDVLKEKSQYYQVILAKERLENKDKGK